MCKYTATRIGTWLPPSSNFMAGAQTSIFRLISIALTTDGAVDILSTLLTIECIMNQRPRFFRLVTRHASVSLFDTQSRLQPDTRLHAPRQEILRKMHVSQYGYFGERPCPNSFVCSDLYFDTGSTFSTQSCVIWADSPVPVPQICFACPIYLCTSLLFAPAPPLAEGSVSLACTSRLRPFSPM